MTTLNWPDMFTSGKTLLSTDKEAATQSLKLLLMSEKQTLFGDPGYGLYIRHFLYTQTSAHLYSIIREEIYEGIKRHIPQIQVKREDITFTSENTTIYVNIVYSYVVGNVSDMFRIALVEE